MKIITISREFGSGGRELGKRLAEKLGFDYYDSEIIAAVAKKSGMDETYVESTLSSHGWQNHAISYGRTLHAGAYSQSSKINLLLEQKKVIEDIAGLSEDCVIVGRNADLILREYAPFNVFVCADIDSKLKRCRERAKENENLTDKELLREMKQIDKGRAETRAIMSDSVWGDRLAYHLTVNTSGGEIKALVPALADYALQWFAESSRAAE